jgi:hypothetical protein
MQDTQRLLDAFAKGVLLRPSPEVPNLVDLARAVALVAGIERVQHTPGARSLAELIGRPEHLVFVMADGLGMDMLAGLPARSFLRAHLAVELQTVFPSTTAVALTTVATGQWPLRHGVTGWWTHVPELQNTAVILRFASRSNGKSLASMGVTVRRALPVPSLMAGARRDTLALFPAELAFSEYSTYFCGGRASQGYASLKDAVDSVLERIKDSPWPTYTYLYTPEVDTAAHRYGITHLEVKRAITGLDQEMERLAMGLLGRGRLVLTSDHGFLDIPQSARHFIKYTDPMMELLRYPPSGDARVLYFHVCEGKHAQLAALLAERLDGKFLVLPVEEGLQLGLMGPGAVSPVTRARLGDIMAISTGPDVVEYREAEGTGSIAFHAAHHSGLTPEEMRIPLVVA